MRRHKGWLIAALLLFGLPLVLVLAVYGTSEWKLRRTYVPRPESLVRPSPAALADAPRQARILGCLSCHGPGLGGNDVFDVPAMGAIMAPSLPHLARERTDAQLATAIRQGIAPDGRGLLVMTSAVFSRLTDEEVSALIAWIRTLPAAGSPAEPMRLSLLARVFVALGDLPPQPEVVPRYRSELPVDLGPALERGRHVAATNCAECHGPALEGGARPYTDFNPSFGEALPATPDLAVASHYSLEQFTRLLRTGVPPDGRDLGMMSEVARSDFSHLTDAEIAALHAYLQARAARR